MLLLLTLLFAQAAPPEAEAAPDLAVEPANDLDPPDGEPDGPDASAREEDPPRSFETSLETAAGRMGERHFEWLVRGRSGEITLTAGAESLVSDRAPERRAAILGAGLVRGELSWEAELRTAPPAAGLSRLNARLGVHGESAGLTLLARDESLHGTRLRAVGAVLELEQEVAPAWNLALSASLWATSLGATPDQRTHDPWSAFGAATLDWAQRWELGVSARRTLGPAALSGALSLAQPAQDGASAVRGALGVEGRLGPAKLTFTVALARLSPEELWLTDAMLGVTWHSGDD